MKKKITIAAGTLFVAFLCVFWFLLPVMKGRELYKSYLQDKFSEVPTIVCEEYHYHLGLRNHGYMGIVWDVDAGSYGKYHFYSIAGTLSVDGETYTMKKRK